LLIFRPFNFIILYFNFKLHFFKFESLNFDREERKLSGNEKGERKWLIDYIPTPKNMELGFIGFFFYKRSIIMVLLNFYLVIASILRPENLIRFNFLYIFYQFKGVEIENDFI
jgi:hypothetical protein